jgi:hypothetical protein
VWPTCSPGSRPPRSAEPVMFDVTPIAVTGTCLRHFARGGGDPAYRGERPASGRRQRGETVAALYLAGDPDTCWAECSRTGSCSAARTPSSTPTPPTCTADGQPTDTHTQAKPTITWTRGRPACSPTSSSPPVSRPAPAGGRQTVADGAAPAASRSGIAGPSREGSTAGHSPSLSHRGVVASVWPVQRPTTGMDEHRAPWPYQALASASPGRSESPGTALPDDRSSSRARASWKPFESAAFRRRRH